MMYICKLKTVKMEAFQIARRKDNIQVIIGTKDVDSEALLEVLRRIQVEFLAQRVNFDDSIHELAKEINRDWWQKNKKRLLGKPDEESHS